jgi:hypothetical protein
MRSMVTGTGREGGMNALFQELMVYEHIADLQAEAAESRLASTGRRRRIARRALRKREAHR